MDVIHSDDVSERALSNINDIIGESYTPSVLTILKSKCNSVILLFKSLIYMIDSKIFIRTSKFGDGKYHKRRR